MGLRVNLYGNSCNIGYVIGKFLRGAGVDAQLFLERDFGWLPEHEDPEIAGAYPDWIHLTGDLRWRRYGIFDNRFVKQLGDCDVVHVSGYGPLWAQKTGRPFVFQTYGGDLRTLPFMTDSLHHRYLARRQANAARNADVVVVGNIHLMRDPARRLGLKRMEVIPLPIDAAKFRPVTGAEVEEVRRRYDGDWLFFHPTRQSWVQERNADTWKANDRLFRAFARFIKAGGASATLLAVEHGPDVEASKALTRELGIERWVRWLPKLQRHELIRLYSAADIVVDQFAEGGYGIIALEAWSCGRPLFIALERRADFGDDQPPAINVATEDQICEGLLEYTNSPERLRAIGDQARQWILRTHDGAALVNRYLECYDSIMPK